jgi:glycine/D-amino acid oxidase-like deaminating enzyme
MPAQPHPLTDDFKWLPYWQEELAPIPSSQPSTLPTKADVVVVGGGLTGVEAARVLALAGKDVLVLDAGQPGAGASTRNAGQVGRNFKHSFTALSGTLGLDRAKGYFKELDTAYQAVAALAAENGDDIGWRKCGRVVAAMSEEHLQRLRSDYELRFHHLGEEVQHLGQADIVREMGSSLYKGGVRVVQNAAVHPGKYFSFMCSRALRAGASILGHTRVVNVDSNGHGFEVRTSGGSVRCQNVLVATNGYTDNAFPWFNKRLAPINSCMIATEARSPAEWQAALPMLRTYHDNRRRSHFMTFSPDGTRLLFGGRTGNLPSSLPKKAFELQADLKFIFPALKDVRISHGWTGRCAATRDLYPHVGVNSQGLHYALGYCFSGNAMGPYLARKAAALILGQAEEARTVFNSTSFAAMPLPARGAWLMPALMTYYAWADRPRGISRAI